MDFIEDLPRAQGKNVILVVVDKLTKYAHFIPINHPFTTKDITDLLVREVMKLQGFSNTMILDWDKFFLSQFWRELFKSAGSKVKFSSAYHPYTDGQTKVVNRGVETYLRCVTGEKPKHWPSCLSWAEFL